MLVEHILLFNGFNIMGSPIRLPFSWWLLCWTALGGCHVNPQSLNWFCHYIYMLVELILLFIGFHIMGGPIRLPIAWWKLCWTALGGYHTDPQSLNWFCHFIGMLVEHWTQMCFLSGLDIFEAWPGDDDDPIWEPSAGSELLINDLNGKKVLFFIARCKSK